jgi:signal transduction histidine kinase/ActR/RegA family two-component response regulator
MSEDANAAMQNARAQAWRRLARERQGNAHRRSAFCALAGLIAALLFGSLAALAWCALVGVVYLIDLKIWRWAENATASQPQANLYGWVFFQALTACGLGPILWFEGGENGKIVAAYYLAAGVFNALVTFKGHGKLLAIGLGTPIVLLSALPIIDFLAAGGGDAALLVPLLGAVVLGLFCLSMWRALSSGEEARIAEHSEALANRVKADEEAEEHGRLLGMVERELRAPLQALSIAMAKLTTLEVSEKARVDLRAAQDAAEVLNLAVGDLSTLSTLQAGGLRTSPSRTEPRALAAALSDAWRAQAHAKWIELFVDVSPAVPEAVELDARRISQVLHQLLANAIRFTRQGGVRLRVDAAQGRDGDGLWIAFTVSDTGPGMEPARLAEVLAPGRRVGLAAKRGFGLGTAISATVAEAMGGRLTGRSVTGQGTAFSLVVPTRALEPGEHPEDSASDAQAFKKPLSILVVDDHAATRRLATVFLSETAAQVAIASSGSQALEMMAEQTFDIVLTDLLMPGMDGYAFAARMRKLGERCRGVGLVAYSADTGAWDIGRAADAGIDGFVAKPFTPSSLLTEIARVAALKATLHNVCGEPPRVGSTTGAALPRSA